jgi:glycosyltransferase involved in cell wall biosynthesis
MTNLRILIVDISVRYGGSNSRVLGLMESFPPASIALAALDKSPLMRQAAAMNLEVYPIARHKIDPRIPFSLLRLIQQKGFQVLDAQNPQSKFWSSFISRRAGAALVSTLNSWYEAEYEGNLKGRIYQWIERVTTAKTDLFIAVSQDIQIRLQNQNRPKEAVVLIPNAVEMNQDFIVADSTWLRKRFELPQDSRVCTAVGRLVWAKGYKHLINAIAKSNNPRLCCVIIGEGRQKKELKELIKQNSLQERIKLLGFQEHRQALKILKSSDMCVMPSLSEGTPISLLEGAMLGTPIVASRVGGIPQLVEDRKHALLVEPGNEMELAEAIDYLLQHPRYATRLAKEARSHVAANFSRQAQQKATQAAYLKAIERARQKNINSN